MDKFKIGDVVRLASGGPRMTVVGLGAEVACTWFVCDGEGWHGPFSSCFGRDVLVLCVAP